MKRIFIILLLVSIQSQAKQITLEDARPTRASDEIFVQGQEADLNINQICSPEFLKGYKDNSYKNALIEACERLLN